MATPVIADLGTPAQIEEFLKPALRGDKIAALGVSEPGAGSDVAGIRTVARADGDDFVIDGQKTFITNGTRADFVTLLVKTQPDGGAHGCSFFLVPTSLKGFVVSKKLEKIGNHASDTAELFFDSVRVPRDYMLGEPNQGFMYLMQNFQTERLIAAVGAAAATKLLLDDAVAYGRERTAFGKPLIKREIWQHRFVDLYTKVEMLQAFVYKCVDHYNEDRYVKKEPISIETVKLISMAKIAAGDLASERMDVVAPQLDLDSAVGAGGTDAHPVAQHPPTDRHRLGRRQCTGVERRAPLLDLVGDQAPCLLEVEAIGADNGLTGGLDRRHAVDAERP
jgi:citronellyl-CoA dehydrogenase